MIDRRALIVGGMAVATAPGARRTLGGAGG